MDIQFFGGRGASSGRKDSAVASSAVEKEPVLGTEMKNVRPVDDYQRKVSNAFEERIKEIGKETGKKVTEGELKEVETALQELMTSEDTHIGIRFASRHLKSILDDERFKSQFETGRLEGYYLLVLEQE